MRPIRIAVPLVAGALLIAGCGGSSSPSQTASAQGRRPGGFASGQNVTQLAKAMGVSKAKLQAALKEVVSQGGRGGFRRGAPPSGGQGAPPSGGQGGPPPGGPRGGRGGPGFGGQFTAQLAKKLGISEAKVQKAFQSMRPPQPGA